MLKRVANSNASCPLVWQPIHCKLVAMQRIEHCFIHSAQDWYGLNQIAVCRPVHCKWWRKSIPRGCHLPTIRESYYWKLLMWGSESQDVLRAFRRCLKKELHLQQSQRTPSSLNLFRNPVLRYRSCPFSLPDKIPSVDDSEVSSKDTKSERTGF